MQTRYEFLKASKDDDCRFGVYQPQASADAIFSRGPYIADEMTDTIVHIYKNDDQRVCCLQPSKDTRKHILLSRKPNFVSFVETDQIGAERIMAKFADSFFLYKPNGIMLQEIKIRGLLLEYSGLSVVAQVS